MDAIDAHHINFHNFNCEVQFDFLNIYIDTLSNTFSKNYIKVKTKTFCKFFCENQIQWVSKTFDSHQTPIITNVEWISKSCKYETHILS